MSYEPDWYDTHCPTCDAPEPFHTATCAVVHPNREVEWEYGVTTKWGVHEHPYLEGAERYAAAVRDEIERGRASGDLEYHGRVMKRTKAKAGEWLPVNENRATDREVGGSS